MNGPEQLLPVDSLIEVRTRFDRQWARGFSVAEPLTEPDPGYRVRRGSDGSVLPVVFRPEDIREDGRVLHHWIP